MSFRVIAPFAVFAGFMAFFWLRARRDGLSTREWLRRRNRETFTAPGWWKPMAVTVGLIALLLIASSALFGQLAAGVFAAAFPVPLTAGVIIVLGWWGRLL